MELEKTYIYQIYLDGSFSRAAEHLYISQPALSLSVKKTEEQLGVPLFDRSHRPLRLTDAGEAYIDSIKKLIHLAADLEKKIRDIRDAETGSICIGGTHFLNAYILPRILASFRRSHPGIVLSLIEQGSDRLAEMLKTQDLDITINCNPAIVPLYEHYPAFYDHILLAVHRSNPLHRDLEGAAFTAPDILAGQHLRENHPAVPLSRFRNEEFILLDEGNNLRDRCLAMFHDYGFEPHILATLSQMVTAYRLAQNSYGLTFVSDRLVSIHDEELLFYSIQSQQSHRLFFLLLPNRSYTSAATRMFVRHALNAFGKH